MSVSILQRIAGVYEGFAAEASIISTAVKVLSPEVYAPPGAPHAQGGFLTVETGNIRFTYHGEDPTADSGHLLLSGSTLRLEGIRTISNFRATRSGPVDATIRVTYER